MSQSFGQRNLNYGELKKFLVQWLVATEGSPEFPWEDGDEALGPLAFDAGLTWGNGNRGTLRWTAAPYEVTTGLPDDMNGNPMVFDASRYYRLSVDASDAAPFVVQHPLLVFPPHVQMVQRIVGITDTWRLYDIHGAGGTIDFDTDAETILIDPGAPFEGIVTIIG